MTFDANRFLDGLYLSPEDLQVPSVAVDGEPGPSAPVPSDPYSELVDRLNADCPAVFTLTADGHRLLDNMFDRVVKAQQTGNPRLIETAVSACERAAQQLFDESVPSIPDEFWHWSDTEE